VRDLVFVTVGTDHHPFDRLVAWADAWVTSGRANGTECLIQTGTSQPPQRAGWRDYLRYDEMVEAMARSVAVVCHGGPATIMDARRLGRVPIVVPRSSRLGEHVDDHQQRFAARMAELGQVHLPHSEDELFGLLDRALADPGAYELHETGDGIPEAVRLFDEMVSELVNGRQEREWVDGR
jgi:UDP-N-acetylglucosamine transferase subunit ALG13